MYKSESQFKRDLITNLEKKGWFCQKIESEGTGVGIPDLYITKDECSAWLELKNEPANYNKGKIEVHWRPGQQAWAIHFAKKSIIPTATIIAFKNGIAAIRTGLELFQDNIVPAKNVCFYKNVQEFIDKLREN